MVETGSSGTCPRVVPHVFKIHLNGTGTSFPPRQSGMRIVPNFIFGKKIKVYGYPRRESEAVKAKYRFLSEKRILVFPGIRVSGLTNPDSFQKITGFGRSHPASAAVNYVLKADFFRNST